MAARFFILLGGDMIRSFFILAVFSMSCGHESEPAPRPTPIPEVSVIESEVVITYLSSKSKRRPCEDISYF